MTGDESGVGVRQMAINDAFDYHMEAGDALDSLLHVDWDKQPEYGQEKIEEAIKNLEDTIDELEMIRDGDDDE